MINFAYLLAKYILATYINKKIKAMHCMLLIDLNLNLLTNVDYYVFKAHKKQLCKQLIFLLDCNS